MPAKAASSSFSILSDSDDDFMMGDAVSDDSDFDFENDSPAVKKSKKVTAAKKATTAATNKKKTTAAATKKKATKKTISIDDEDDVVMTSTSRPVLAEKSTNSDASDMTSDSTKKKGTSKTLEETYKKLSQLDHILVRPDTYIGSVERCTQEMYVLQGEEIVEKEITYTPGLYKIYDEILVNAADNKQRDPNMDKLEIEISSEKNTISVKNNGKGIPIEFHKDEKLYVPTLVFGHLLTGSNFDDNEKKTTGGRNGFGAKLANIFSTEFIVECADTNTGLSFKQVFRKNMKERDEPIIKQLSSAQQKKGDFVKITFSPDLEKFKMTSLDEDIVSLFSKRAYDIAGSMARSDGKTLAVTLNGNKVPVKKFTDYLKLYKNMEQPIAFEDDGKHWEIGVGVSDGSFKQVSFVNAICTSKGGEHVNAIASLVAKRVLAKIQKKSQSKNMKISENQIKNYLTVFVNCLIVNPAFDSQTKESLTTKKSQFGSKCELSDKFLAKVEKSNVIEKVISFAMFKEKQGLKSKGGTKKIKLTGISKLDDANFAGSAKSSDCTLILTEGDSAKSLAMSGVSVVGRDYYGVFPLKGKPLNVREAAISTVTKNDEIKNIIDIMGLKFNTTYDESNIKSLRYGHLMIMADQDHDGSHIKGLIINFLHNYWPSLLDIPGFLQQFITPIVKATKGKQTKTFFTLPEYEKWKESTGNDAKGWRIKYYKGLGTSTSAEAKDYFSNLDKHEINFCELSADECRIVPVTYDNSDGDDENPDVSRDIILEQVKSGSDMIDLAFSKKKVEERKGWLSNLEKDTYLDYSLAQKNNGVKFTDFINKELILFSQADNFRSIPHAYDGFKPSQRKVLFGCFLKNLKNEMKVAQLCGYIGEKSAYHHGEASLQGTIVNMAQDFTGSNNINLLTPSGQFGTRRMGGKDSASPRYIFTKLEKITRAIFHPDDDALLSYLHEDGESIEPEFYLPIIPMALVNGADGIGTGWSTSIPNYNPRDIIANIKRKLNGEEIEKMHPYYFGFNGTIEENDSNGYLVSGKIDRLDDTTLHISELPIKVWTQDYKNFLEKMMTGDEKKKGETEIKDFKENHTDTTVSFTVTATKEFIDKVEKDKEGLLGKFKLRSKISTSNMNVFDKHGRIIKFANPEALLDSFYRERLHYYSLRKNHLLDQMRREQRMLSNKARFVEEVCSGDLIVSNRKRAQILADLKDRNYELFQKQNNNARQEQENETEDEEVDDENDIADLAKGYEYLLGMKIWSLTYERAEQLRKELAEKTKSVKDLEATSPEQLWKNDLNILQNELDDRDQAYADAAEEELKAQGKNMKRQATKKKQAKKKAIKKDSDDSDDDYFDAVEKRKKTVAKKEAKLTAAPRVLAKPTVVKKSPKKAIDDELSSLDFKSSGSDENLFSTTTNEITLKKKEAKPTTVSSSKIVSSIEVDSDSEPEEMSLFDRMQRKTGATKTISKAAVTNKGKKRSSPKTSKIDEDDDLDAFDTSSYEPASLTPAPKRKKSTKKKIVKKAIEIESDDDMFDELNEASDSDDDEVAIVEPRSRPTRERKTVKYSADSDDSDDDDDDFDFDE